VVEANTKAAPAITAAECTTMVAGALFKFVAVEVIPAMTSDTVVEATFNMVAVVPVGDVMHVDYKWL